MGFSDVLKSVKEIGSRITTSVSNTVKEIQMNGKLSNEAYQIKRKILLNLSLTELKSVAYLVGLEGLEYNTQVDDHGNFKKVKVKLNKFDYVDNIANKPYSELVLKLKHIRKSSLADEMEREVSFIEKKLKEEKDFIRKGSNNLEREMHKDVLLTTFVKTIIEEIISVSPERYAKEKDYQIELKGALKVAVRKDFPKSNVSVEMEHSTNTGKRIDIFIQIDNYKIGIETKYDLSSSGHFQRAVGQALEYSKFLNALIVVQYKTLEDETGLNNLKELSKHITIPFNVVANGVVKI